MSPFLLALLVLPQQSFDFDRLQGWVGVDDGAIGRSGEAIFRIELDGKPVFKTDVMLPGEAPKPVDIPISGANSLSLFVDDEGDGHGGDWGEWLDIRLVNTRTGQFTFLTDLTPEEKAWIPAHRDRSIVDAKLSVSGRTFLRGWGCISGSVLTFKNWKEDVLAIEKQIDYDNAIAAKQVPTLHLHSTAKMPSDAKLFLDQKSLSEADLRRGVPVKPTSVIAVTTDLDNPDHRLWRASLSVRTSTANFSLFDLLQPTSRVLHKAISPNRIAVMGSMLTRTVGEIAGKPFPPSGLATFYMRDFGFAVRRLLVPTAPSSTKLLLRAKRAPNHEVEVPELATSSMLTIWVDGEELTAAQSDRPESWVQDVSLRSKPDKVELRIRPGADGRLADSWNLDIGVESSGSPTLWLATIDPDSIVTEGSASLSRLALSRQWSAPPVVTANWNALDAIATARAKAAGNRPRALGNLAIAKDSTAARAAASLVLGIDEGEPELRAALAERLEAIGDLEGAREEWGRLIERSRGDAATHRSARLKRDALWARIEAAPSPMPDDGPQKPAPIAALTTASVNNLPALVGLNLTAITNYESKIDLAVNEKVRILVAGMGLAVQIKVLRGGKVESSASGVHPSVEVSPGGDPVQIVVSQDPDETGVLIDSTVFVAVTGSSVTEKPTWKMTIEADGSAAISTESRVPVFAAIPRTASQLIVRQGQYALTEPITDYAVAPQAKLGPEFLPLLAVPTGTEPMTIEYRWPDAAYNVPMSKYDWGRIDATFFSSPPNLSDDSAAWIVQSLPRGWNAKRVTPAALVADPLTVSAPAGGSWSAEWAAHQAPTAWTAASYRNATIFVPDNASNRRWLPTWMAAFRQVYDRLLDFSGHERAVVLYIGVQQASMLSGYGGGTLGDEHKSETWVPAPGRLAPWIWKHGPNPSALDAHELHWVALAAMPDSAPNWLKAGWGAWLEESAWRSSGQPLATDMFRQRTEQARAALSWLQARRENPLQLDETGFSAIPGETRDMLTSLVWQLCEELSARYGKDFWAKYWAEMMRHDADAMAVLSERGKTRRAIDLLVRLTADAKLKDRFTSQWRFDLTPDPKEAPDRLLILPLQPKITADDRPDFIKPDWDSKDWHAVTGPGDLERVAPQFARAQGAVWYRFEFEVPATFSRTNLELRMLDIVGSDDTYLNGSRIGSTSQGAAGQRTYSVPKDQLFLGRRNVIAIRLFPSADGTGIRKVPYLVSKL